MRTFRQTGPALCLVFAWWTAFGAAAAEPDKQGLDFFETKIRPVLVEHCYQCHSAQAAANKNLKGSLLLDSRDAARRGGESGPSVVPGDPDESLLVSALRHDSFEMPPKGKLPDAVIEDFVKWIEMGAPDPREGSAPVAEKTIDIAARRSFWSFQPLQRREPPPAADSSWIGTPIDRFVLARQAAAGLKPNDIADPRTLVRRAWFDLLGLPPTPEELETWIHRLAPGAQPESATGPAPPNALPLHPAIDRQAYAEMIDVLLDNDHYGERWARHWMDVARFAESHGYEQDYNRPHAYHYRDFLIKALNTDMPYDQFVRWQLAGDELAPDDPLALMATGFLGAGAFPTQLTEAEFESARYDELDDMVATTGVAFLGLSIGCARCHDHKFDPIRSRDYYRMAASFTTAIRSEIDLDLDPQGNARRDEQREAKLHELTAELERFERDVLPDQLRDWLTTYDPATQSLSPWEVLDGNVTSSGGSKFVEQGDGSYLATGDAPAKEVITFVAQTRRPGIAAFRLEALTHKSLPRQGPGRAANGNFALGDFQVTARAADAQGEPVAVKLIAARATHEQNNSSLSVAASIDADPVSGWAVDGQIGRDQAAVFVAQQPLDFPAGIELTFRLTCNHPNSKHAIGRLRLSVTRQRDTEPVVGSDGPDAKVVDALARAKQAGDSDADAWQVAARWYKTTLPAWQQLHQKLSDLRQASPAAKPTKVMVTSEGWPHLKHHADGRGFPHFYPETYQLRRGDVHQKVEPVTQGFLPVLIRDEYDESHWQNQPPEGWTRTSFRRAALAAWMTDVEHGAGHLAARVIVNRLWQHHFGRGIVATPSDFGAAGERPSHPELLDYLAADLVANDWRLKRLHRLIMTSSVYMQSVAFDEQRAKIDRENTYLWRRAPRRLEAEAIRDAMLAVSGQLDTTMYGPGTLDANMARRSVYFFIKRSQLVPMMMLFDWPEHLVSIGRRASTTIAPQALMFMNSPQGRRYAESFARRLQGMEEQDAVREAYRIAFGRLPDDRERTLATQFLTQQSAAHTAAGHADVENLARIDLCQTLMSMNEFVYID